MAESSGAGAGTSMSESIAHLPDASEEVAATADLTISVGGAALKVHSVVLAAGSRVLRSAFATCGGDAAARAAAVTEAFHGHQLADVQSFLRLMYDATVAEGMGVQVQDWQGVLELSDKLDAPAVLRACEWYLTRLLGATSAVSWHGWLLLADRLNMARLVERCVKPVVSDLVSSCSRAKQILPLLSPSASAPIS